MFVERLRPSLNIDKLEAVDDELSFIVKCCISIGYTLVNLYSLLDHFNGAATFSRMTFAE